MKKIIFGGNMKNTNQTFIPGINKIGISALSLSLLLILFGVGNVNAQEIQEEQAEQSQDFDGDEMGILTPPTLNEPSVAPLAVDALQENINQPTNQPRQELRPPLDYTQSSNDEATYFRNTSLDQAKLNALRLQNSIEKALMDGERERMKFMEEGGVLPGGAGTGNPQGQGQINQPQQNQTQTQGNGAVVEEEEDPYDKPILRGVYSYSNTTYAEMIVEGRRTMAETGSTLRDGSKVVGITPTQVTLSHKGKTHVIFMEGDAFDG